MRNFMLRERLSNVDTKRALIGLTISCVGGLSVHVLMLQVAHVPYPRGYPTTGWPVLCGMALCAFALLSLCKLCEDRLRTLSLLSRILLIGCIAAMLREAIRVSILGGVVTTAWRYSFVSGLPRLLLPFFLAGLCVPFAAYLRRPAARIGAALVVAALVTYLCLPMLSWSTAHALQAMSNLNHEEVYKVPYGWQVEIPSYITFLEPTIAAFALAALVLDRLSPHLFVNTLQFVLLVMGLNTTLLRPLLYLPFAPYSAPLAMLSSSQFFLEWVVLSACVAATWRLASRSRTVASA